MDTDKLITFFNKKLGEMPEMRQLNTEDQRFKTWWKSIESTCERMGATYAGKAKNVNFYPMVYNMYGDNDYAAPYASGMNDAEAFMKSLVEELELWGYSSSSTDLDKQSSRGKQVVLNLTITQQQSQKIAQTINLSQYDQNVQDKVQELLSELRKKDKSKKKISDTVKWLADKGVDALISILLASANLA